MIAKAWIVGVWLAIGVQVVHAREPTYEDLRDFAQDMADLQVVTHSQTIHDYQRVTLLGSNQWKILELDNKDVVLVEKASTQASTLREKAVDEAHKSICSATRAPALGSADLIELVHSVQREDQELHQALDEVYSSLRSALSTSAFLALDEFLTESLRRTAFQVDVNMLEAMSTHPEVWDYVLRTMCSGTADESDIAVGDTIIMVEEG